jgi:O-antigen/teichoic acid export membrane protein
VTVKQDPELEQEWLRQNSLGYAALIAIGVVMVQPFLTAGAPDPSARICIIAFSVAIPFLAALVLLNRQEVFRRRRARSVPVAIAQVVAQVCASVGLVAGFWHILWIAGVAMLAAGLVAVAVHTAGYTRLERDQRRLLAAEGPGDTES